MGLLVVGRLNSTISGDNDGEGDPDVSDKPRSYSSTLVKALMEATPTHQTVQTHQPQ